MHQPSMKIATFIAALLAALNMLSFAATREESRSKPALSVMPAAGPSEKLIVFVHGFSGDASLTWTNGSRKSWLDLIYYSRPATAALWWTLERPRA